MKYKILLGVIILFLFFPSISATIMEYDNPWEPFTNPEFPIDGNCWNLGYFNNVTPHNGDWNVDITAKGVQVCVNVTPPQGCSLNVTYEWLNYTQYYSDWLDWANAQPWGYWWDFEDWYEDIDWDNQTTWENNSYWYEFSPTYSGINQITQICAYNTNVSCQIENDFTREFFDWRINYTLNCSGQFTQDYCYYYFEPEECSNITYIYPPSPNGTVCPCCDSMCIGINNSDGHLMNLTFYRNDSQFEEFYIVNQLFQISNNTYCFCIDGHINNSIYYPVRFNEIYHWYVNITDAETGEYEITDIFQFRTPPDPSWCPCGPEDLIALMEDTDTIRSDTWIVGLIFVLMALPLAVALKKRKKKRKKQTQIYPMEFRRNY